MKKAYYYFFYKIYKFWDYVSVPKFLSDWKAGLSVGVLELWCFLTMINCYGIINRIKPNSSLTSPLIFIPLFIIIVLNYITFNHYDNVWKEFNKEFDSLPKRKNLIGGVIVWGIILFIILIYFISTFHLHKIIYGEY